MRRSWKAEIEKHREAYPIIRDKFFRYMEEAGYPPQSFRTKLRFLYYLQIRLFQPESRVTITEYGIFRFYRMKKKKRLAFMTDYEATIRMKPYTEASKQYLWDKVSFLHEFAPFIHRRWIRVRETDYDAFCTLVGERVRWAAKPACSSWGIGFRLFEPEKEKDLRSVYEEFRKRDYVLEEYLEGHPALQKFHPQSLNTVRIITFQNGKDFHVFGAGLRMGNHGSFVDNAHAGGVFCEIDPRTGVICTDGMDEWGRTYRAHPATGVPFRGYEIPRWQEMIDLCEKAGRQLSCLAVVGWDIALLADGSLELIEGNHNPGMNIVQAPAGRGRKQEFEALLRRFYGTEEKREPQK